MGIRGELFSTRVGCEGRTYFFNVKENRNGDMYLTVVESKPSETEGFERRSVVVFREDMADFVKALQGALDFMGKSGPGVPAPAIALLEGKGARRTAGLSGFAGSGEAAAPKKRRVVVKRKGPEPDAPKA
jgi:Protein of unknown function (DUF3276).